MALVSHVARLVAVPSPFRRSSVLFSAPVESVRSLRDQVLYGLAAVAAFLGTLWMFRMLGVGFSATFDDLQMAFWLLVGCAYAVFGLKERMAGPAAETIALHPSGILELNVGGRLRALGTSRWGVPHDREYFVRVNAQTETALPTPVEIDVGPFPTEEDAQRAEERLKEAVAA